MTITASESESGTGTGTASAPAPSEQLARVLTAAVQRATGLATDRPRPGQMLAAQDIYAAMTSEVPGHVAQAAPTGVGKALDLNTPIATSSGWSTMGQLRPGDEIFDENGQICRVTGISPIMNDRNCYEVVFSDGEVIIADEEHLWATATRQLRLAHSEHRRIGVRYNSATRHERILKLDAARESIAESGYLFTMAGAITRLQSLADPTTIMEARYRVGGSRLARGETLDLRPVLDNMLERQRSRSAFGKAAPKPYEILTTQQLLDSLLFKDGALNHAVPVAGSLQLPEAQLPISSYLLGAWLGDGDSDRGVFTVGSEDIEEMRRLLSAEWPRVTERPSNGGNFLLTCKQPDADRCPYGHNDRMSCGQCRPCAKWWGDGLHAKDHPVGARWNESLGTKLRALGVHMNKRIPTIYLRASFQQRLALLQGLMDTDGTVRDDGRSELALCSEQLAADSFELVQSLGIKAAMRSGPATITEDDPARPGKTRRRNVGIRWRIGFTTPLDVFRLPRKSQLNQAAARRNKFMTMYRYVAVIRPVASRPVRCITVDSESRLFLAGTALIPTHNSMAALSTSMLRAAVAGERTVIATESLGLQGQYLDKDAPPVAAAVAAETGRHIKVALLKGWSNYACAVTAMDTAAAVLGREHSALTKLGPAKVADLLDAKARPTGLSSAAATTVIDWVPLPTLELARAAAWALRQSLGAGTGDKDKYPHAIGYEVWAAVSTTPAECLGQSCPLLDICRPTAARVEAAEADILITNHAMLGVQAAVNAPIVVGSKKLGHIDHIIVDEAHALPGIVRSQGAKELSGRRVRSTVSVLGGALAETDPPVARMLADGLAVADAVDAELARYARESKDKDAVASISEVGDPLEDTGPMLSKWIEDAKTMLKQMLDKSNGSPQVMRRSRRATDRLSGLSADLVAIRVYRDGIARWVEREETRPGQRPQPPAAKASPVDVAPMLIGSLWNSVDNRDSGDEPQVDREARELERDRIALGGAVDCDEGSTVAPPETKYPLSVTCLSATLPAGFCGDTGLKARVKHYESPFDGAYGRSALFVPRATDPADVAALSVPNRFGGKPQLDVKLHRTWAMKHIAALVAANRGAALVLAATSEAGKFYAAELRKISGGRWNVYSQWDGRSTPQLLADWKADTHSIMVGTKSLMTGVDAPGPTCSLVILDRVPRAPANPVDNARVKLLTERLNSKWLADSAVYAGDAALLLEQAAGRLIRSISDHGMVAVLDPRLLKPAGSAFTYATTSRNLLMAALKRFDRKMSLIADAVAFLSEPQQAAG